MKLLIDECLSEELAKRARGRGHADASHVRWIGKGGAKDWDLMPVIVAGDWTFVTRNARNFRGPPEAAGASGEYAAVDPHAGYMRPRRIFWWCATDFPDVPPPAPAPGGHWPPRSGRGR